MDIEDATDVQVLTEIRDQVMSEYERAYKHHSSIESALNQLTHSHTYTSNQLTSTERDKNLLHKSIDSRVRTAQPLVQKIHTACELITSAHTPLTRHILDSIAALSASTDPSNNPLNSITMMDGMDATPLARWMESVRESLQGGVCEGMRVIESLVKDSHADVIVCNHERNAASKALDQSQSLSPGTGSDSSSKHSPLVLGPCPTCGQPMDPSLIHSHTSNLADSLSELTNTHSHLTSTHSQLASVQSTINDIKSNTEQLVSLLCSLSPDDRFFTAWN